ncbi:unnamed protein product [Mucor fragilis]
MNTSGSIKNQSKPRSEVLARLVEARESRRQRENKGNYKSESVLKINLVQLNFKLSRGLMVLIVLTVKPSRPLYRVYSSQIGGGSCPFSQVSFSTTGQSACAP